jgi:hypothetical protein
MFQAAQLNQDAGGVAAVKNEKVKLQGCLY